MMALWILPLLAVGASAIVCTPHICDDVKCQNMELCAGENMYVKEKGGFCGCCDQCITLTEEGGFCPGPLMGVPATTECKPGTKCNWNTHRCEATRKKRATGPCAEERERLSEKEPLPGLVLPSCDEDGYYAPKQHLGSVSFCVDKQGKQLKQYKGHISESSEMSCKCAREEEGLKHTWGKRVYCTSNGNYKGMQCLGTKCFCVDSKEGTSIGEFISRWEANKLNC